ncbi:MAG: 1-(5-phosphoribosyl)-5-amino-4-imidazole-carboxylate carboxylase, partial [Bacteroidota bacterium]
MSNHNIDKNREKRTGFPEVIYGESKNIDDLLSILEQYKNNDKNALITRLQAQKANELKRVFKDSFFDEVSGIFFLRNIQSTNISNNHEVAILSGGTSDIAV